MWSPLDDSSSSDMETGSEEEYREISPPHRHRKRFSLIEISCRNFVRKIMTFETRCPVLSSSWEVEIKLSKLDLFENFTISLTLRRKDSGQIPITGYVLAYLSNFDDKVCRIPYPMKGDLPYIERVDEQEIVRQELTESFLVDDHYKCLFMVGCQKFRYDMLLVKTQLLIIGCCGSSDPRGKSE